MTTTTTSVSATERRVLSVAERMIRAFIVSFGPVLYLQLTTNTINLSDLELAAVAAAGPALSALLSALGIVLPWTNPRTPSLLPAKYDTATAPVPQVWHGDGEYDPTGAQPVIAAVPPRAAARAGHDPVPAGSTWTGPQVVEASPWQDGHTSAGIVPGLNAGETENIAVTQPTEPHLLEHPTIGHYGWKPQPPDPNDWQLMTDSLPERYTGSFVDLSAQFPDEPYDQLALGACVSNGTAAVVDFARQKQGLTPLRPPARLFIYWEGRNLEGTVSEDSGLYVRDGIKVVATLGAPPETDYPYDIAKFTDPPSAQAVTDAKLDVTVKYLAVTKAQIYDTIASGYPVVFGFNVPPDFEGAAIAANGVMPVSSWLAKKNIGGHCTVIVSTPTTVTDKAGATYEAVKVRNSWGPGWGENGYFWMPTQFLQGANTSDFWMVAALNDPAPQPTPTPTPSPAGDGFMTALAGYQGAAAELSSRAASHRVPAGQPKLTDEQYAAWIVAGNLGKR